MRGEFGMNNPLDFSIIKIEGSDAHECHVLSPKMTFDQSNLNQFHLENGWNACMIH